MTGQAVTVEESRSTPFDWSAVSEAWDEQHEYIERSAAPITDRLLADLDAMPGDSIVELGAGTGEFGIHLARAVQPGGHVVISDVAEGMVEVAARRLAGAAVEGVDVRRLDGQAIALPDDSVDGVVSRMGYMLMPNPAAAFDEARRILRPGGRLVFSVWAGPQANAWASCAGIAVAQAGLGDPVEVFKPGGLFSLADEERVRELLGGASFVSVSIERVDAVHEFKDFEHYWNTFSRVAGPVAVILDNAPADQVTRVKEAAKVFAEPYAGAGGLQLPAQALCVVAR